MRYVIIVWAIFLTVGLAVTAQPPQAPAQAPPSGSAVNRCSGPTPTADPTQGPSWMSWGNDASNSRFAPQGGLTAADVPRLKLKWAFGYEGITSARVQPAMAGGKLFVASDNAELNALDPKTGCAYWTFKAEFGVRSALTVGPYSSGGAHAATPCSSATSAPTRTPSTPSPAG